MTYDELLDAVRGRVGRYAASSDAEDVLDPAGLRDVESMTAVAPHGGTDDAWHAAGLLHYARHLALPDGGRAADLAAAEPLLDRVRSTVAELPEQVRKLDEAATRPVRLTPGRVAVFGYAGSALKEVDDVIVMIRHRLRSLPADDPDVLPTRASLTEAQELRFGRTGDVADLDAAIATAQGVLPDTPADDPATRTGSARWRSCSSRGSSRARIRSTSTRPSRGSGTRWRLPRTTTRTTRCTSRTSAARCSPGTPTPRRSPATSTMRWR